MTLISLPSYRRALVVMLATALPGLLLVFLTPPYQVPDEPAHFRRILAMSRGDLTARIVEGHAGSQLPASLQTFEEIHLDHMIGDPSRNYGSERLRRSARLDRSREERFLPYPTAALFSPLPYAAPALFVSVAHLVHDGFLTAFYLGRAVNVVLGAAILALAIAVAPDLRVILLPLGALPMAMVLRSSLSADVLTFSLSWLLVAVVVSEIRSGHQPPLLRALLGALVVMTKPSFVAISIAGLVPPAIRRQWKDGVMYLVVLGGASLLAAVLTSSVLVPVRSDVGTDPRGQIERTYTEPLHVTRLVLSDLRANAPRYGVEAIGRLGWLDTPLPRGFVPAFALMFVVAVVTAPQLAWIPAGPRAAFLVLALLGILVVIWSNFVLWTPPTAVGIEGVQGRHFLPVAPLFLIAVGGMLPVRAALGWQPRIAWGLAGAGTLITIGVTLHRYWI